MIRTPGSTLALLLLLAGCGAADAPRAQTDTNDTEATEARPVEAISLLGEELRRPELPDAFRQQQSTLLAEARAALETASADVRAERSAALIWVGRRQAYLGRYGEAIDTYTRGLETDPENAALYRHRGHRYITTRRLDEALADLSRAAELVEGRPDEVEQDGLPNERGIPTSTLKSNIFYHLGLAHYLRGDFENALDAYRRCLEVSSTEDNVVATTHWLYMTLRRLGRDTEAAAALEPITADMDIIENHEYYRLLRMYKGEVDPDVMWTEVRRGAASLGSATSGYGVGNWLFYEGTTGDGDRDAAFDLFSHIHSGNQWAAFGYIAAEAELARLDVEERELRGWRAERLDELLADNGWLSAVGLFWLDEGRFTFGTGAGADLDFAAAETVPDAPSGIYGTLVVEGSGENRRFVVEPAEEVDIQVGGRTVSEPLELATDANGPATEMEVTPYRFYLIERSARPFLRVLDLARPSRTEIPRLSHYAYDPSWRIEARFEAYDPPRTIPVPTILETTNQSPSPGALVFERDGRSHRLDAIDSDDDLYIIFADDTTGEETYSGGRYIYTEWADAQGMVTLDFNRAHNPPCVFTAHATCPLPPRQNRLDLRVEAGETMLSGFLEP